MKSEAGDDLPRKGSTAGAGEQQHRPASPLPPGATAEISRLYGGIYGREPQKARGYLHPTFLLVAFAGVLSAEEERLICHGNANLVRDLRERMLEWERPPFMAAAERLTGRSVNRIESVLDIGDDAAALRFFF